MIEPPISTSGALRKFKPTRYPAIGAEILSGAELRAARGRPAI
jgi:hypothetical protein